MNHGNISAAVCPPDTDSWYLSLSNENKVIHLRSLDLSVTAPSARLPVDHQSLTSLLADE